MGTEMKRKSEIDMEQFDDAMTDAFSNAPSCGDFGEIDALRRRRMINRILSASTPAVLHGGDHFKPQPQTHFTRWIWIAAAVFVATIATAFFVRMTFLPTADDVKTAPGQTWFGEVLKAGANVIMDRRSVSSHARIPVDKSIFTNSDHALLRLPTGIEWWLSAESEGRVAAVAETQLDVAVKKGESWFRVDPERKDAPAFTVLTPQGRIHVTGTIFVVNVTVSDVFVTLLKGQVWIERDSGGKALLKQGHIMRLRDGRQTTLDGVDMQRHQRQLVELEWRDASILHDDNAVGDTVTVDKKPQSVEPSKEYASSRHAQREKQVDVQQVHREIQSARTRGEWQRVALLYQQIIQAAPDSEAAMVSRVSLGEVYLTKLHRYDDALKQFNRYIFHSKNKALLQEALYGKCTSLKSLKKSTSEQKCLEKFIKKFPTVFQASDANTRLRELQQQQAND